MADKHAGGRPPQFKSAGEMQILIDQYFKDCQGTIVEDKDGIPILSKYDEPIMIGAKPYTITGLALALGFTSRTSLLNYQGKKEFMNTITRAKSHVEEYAETRLFDKDGANGAKFSLANNFKDWREKTDMSINGSMVVFKGEDKLED